MEKKISWGLLTIAVGDSAYYRMAQTMVQSFKNYHPEIPVCAVVESAAEGRVIGADRLEVIDILPEERGVNLKKNIGRYSPYENTLFVDCDCIFVSDISAHIINLNKFSFSPVVDTRWKLSRDTFNFTDSKDTLNTLGIDDCLKFNGGVYWFKKDEVAFKFFATVLEVEKRSHELGLKPFDQSGINEEILFSLAMALNGQYEAYEDGGYLMRTPLGINGAFRVSKRGVRFRKYYDEVAPAIVHFCGPWSKTVEYNSVKQLHVNKNYVAYLFAYFLCWYRNLYRYGAELKQEMLEGQARWKALAEENGVGKY